MSLVGLRRFSVATLLVVFAFGTALSCGAQSTVDDLDEHLTPATLEVVTFRVNSAAVVVHYDEIARGQTQQWDIARQPAGAHHLVIEAPLTSDLIAAVSQLDNTITLSRQTQPIMSWSVVMVTDSAGAILRTTLLAIDDTMQLQVEDADARYPVRVQTVCHDLRVPAPNAAPAPTPTTHGDRIYRPSSGSAASSVGATHDASTAPVFCPSYWCGDGDPGTADVCKRGHGDSFTCASAFDRTLEGQPCGFGRHCCADMRYHADCDRAASRPGSCPDQWCDDSDTSTLDICDNHDAKTSTFECEHPFEPTFAGQACTFGAYCCAGVYCSADGQCGDSGCACADGFTGDGITCTDIDECALGTSDCDAHAMCTNTIGGYECTAPVSSLNSIFVTLPIKL